jgi:hypothetical protein
MRKRTVCQRNPNGGTAVLVSAFQCRQVHPMAPRRKGANSAIQSCGKHRDLIKWDGGFPSVEESKANTRAAVEAAPYRVDTADLWPRCAKPRNFDARWTNSDRYTAADCSCFSFGQKVQNDARRKPCQRGAQHDGQDDDEPDTSQSVALPDIDQHQQCDGDRQAKQARPYEVSPPLPLFG